MIKLAPSILSANFAKLGEDIAMLHKSQAEYVHIDIMDGAFVPATSFGAPVVKAIRGYTDKVFDVHLMINNPDSHLQSFADAGADIITVHSEAVCHLHRTVQNIKRLGKKAGVVLNPATPICVLDYVLEDLDMVLLMSVNPGFGGQRYIEQVTSKVAGLRSEIERRGLVVDIEIDGGITHDNVERVICAGANVIVAGSSVFSGNPIDNINKFKHIFEEVMR